VVLRDGKPFLALSSPGGDSQDQQALQVFLNIAVFNMRPQEAIEAPRFNSLHHDESFGDHSFQPGVVEVEDRIPPGVVESLRRLGHKVEVQGSFMMNTGTALAGVDAEHGTVFGAEVRFRAGHEPLAIVTADFDADGHRDILVANSTPDSAGVQGPLSLLRGRGDGSFDPEARVGAPTAVARELPAAAQRIRNRLESGHLQLPGVERLPVTVSVGIAYFPFHAGSVTELVSAATTALAEAKAGGGNEISIADAWTSEPRTPHTTFDVLQGLVLAIDRKDRYTKLHSEDVAAYALFLAGRLGLPDEMLKSLRIAALLHDVGKIGVPDDILRKPGRLTPYEYEIVKQHVALGDLIVRDVPDVEHIREGVRYHHERWDGQGYMVGLAGENIPLIARILAVADAFSAMTTSRPYRKALPAERALDELRAVAGTQLDGQLVASFVAAMEQDPDAPRPGAFRSPDLLWKPATRAA